MMMEADSYNAGGTAPIQPQRPENQGTDGGCPSPRQKGQTPGALLSEGSRRCTSQLKQRVQTHPLLSVLSRPSRAGMMPTCGHLSRSMNSEANLVHRHAQKCWPAISASLDPVEWTQKINLCGDVGSSFVPLLARPPPQSILNTQPEEPL